MRCLCDTVFARCAAGRGPALPHCRGSPDFTGEPGPSNTSPMLPISRIRYLDDGTFLRSPRKGNKCPPQAGGYDGVLGCFATQPCHASPCRRAAKKPTFLPSKPGRALVGGFRTESLQGIVGSTRLLDIPAFCFRYPVQGLTAVAGYQFDTTQSRDAVTSPETGSSGPMSNHHAYCVLG